MRAPAVAGLVAIVLVALVALPFVANNYVVRLTTVVAMYAALAVSWNFIGGLAGYPSFATAAFFGLGAYAGAIAQARGAAMIPAWIGAGVVSALFAGVLGLAILRLRGHYFAIASLVVGEVLRELTTTATSLTGGGMGLNLPILRLDVTAAARVFYAAMVVLAAVAVATFVLVRRGRLGFALSAIRQNEDAATMIGVDTTRAKTAGFVLSALFAGVAGGIYASWVNYIEPTDVFDVLISVKPIVMVLLGGAATIVGPLVGAVVFLVLEELVWRNFLTIHAGLLGAIIVVLVFVLPRGLLALDLRRVLARPPAPRSSP